LRERERERARESEREEKRREEKRREEKREKREKGFTFEKHEGFHHAVHASILIEDLQKIIFNF